MNKCMFSGRVSSQPEIYAGKENAQNKIARFNFAVDDPYLNKDGQQNTVFINCVCFNNSRVELLEKHVDKGDALILTCSFRTTEYVNKEGVKQYGYEFVVSEIEFNESKAAKDARKNRQQTQQAQAQPPVYGQAQQQVPNYGQGGYGQAQQQAPTYGQAPAYGQAQQAPTYGQAPAYGQAQQAPTYNQQQAPIYGQAPVYGQAQQQPSQAPQQPAAPIIPGASMMGLGIPDDELPFN